MITDVEYMQIVNEIYDLSDYRTKKNILFCNEAKKVENVEFIVGKLYTHIKNDVNGIDFSTIAKSKGIISKIENYDELNDCINTVHDLVQSYNESTKPIDVFSTAIANIQARERDFSKAFALNIEFPIMIYNTTVMSIVSAVSLLITASIDFIKEGHESFAASLDKAGYRKSQTNMLYQYLQQFNNSCKSGVIDKIISGCIKNNLTATRENADLETVDESIGSAIQTGLSFATAGLSIAGAMATISSELPIIGIIVAVGFGAIAFLWSMKNIIYFFLRTRLGISDWFEAQATFLQINAENLKHREDSKGEDHKKKVYQRQIKWVERFRKISNFLALKDSKASKETKDHEEEERRKRRTDDDSSNNDGGGLF